MTKLPTLGAENLVALGFLQSVSYIKPVPTHEKIFAVGKSGPNATFNLLFLGWVGLGLWGVRRFQHNKINRIWYIAKHPLNFHKKNSGGRGAQAFL